MNQDEARWMGLDVGDVRIGVALTDPLRVMAQPYRVVTRRTTETAIEEIVELAKANGIERIIVGIPLAQDASRGPMAQRISEFAQSLRRAIAIPVIEWDERFSTRQATRALRQGKVPRKKRKESVDKTAAALILQNYLDAQRATAPDPEARDYLRWAMEGDDVES